MNGSVRGFVAVIVLCSSALPGAGQEAAPLFRQGQLLARSAEEWPEIQVFVDREWLMGAMDGQNREFRLRARANPTSSLKVFRNGVCLRPGMDYVVIGDSVISFLPHSTPQVGDVLEACYQTTLRVSPSAKDAALHDWAASAASPVKTMVEFHESYQRMAVSQIELDLRGDALTVGSTSGTTQPMGSSGYTLREGERLRDVPLVPCILPGQAVGPGRGALSADPGHAQRQTTTLSGAPPLPARPLPEATSTSTDCNPKPARLECLLHLGRMLKMDLSEVERFSASAKGSDATVCANQGSRAPSRISPAGRRIEQQYRSPAVRTLLRQLQKEEHR